MVIIGRRYSRSTFGANNQTRNPGPALTQLLTVGTGPLMTLCVKAFIIALFVSFGDAVIFWHLSAILGLLLS